VVKYSGMGWAKHLAGMRVTDVGLVQERMKLFGRNESM